MAAVDVVIAAPAPPPPAPVVRISRLALAAGDAVVCLWIASLWVSIASFAAMLIGLLVCGWECTDAARTALLVSLLFLVIFWPCATMVLTKLDYINELEKGAAALEPISEDIVNGHLIAILASAALEFYGFLLKLLAVNDHPTARTASVIMVLAPLGICVICCLVSIPGLAVRVWRMRRHCRASVVPI